MRWDKGRRIVAGLTLITFWVTNYQGLAPAHADAIRPESVMRGQTFNIPGIQVPEKFGEVVESWQGQNPETVVLIQDAHSIPDAQKNIANLIRWFQARYGVNKIALEGAAGRLDAKIFRSFPDKKLLRDVFKGYLNAGEIAGGAAAAVFNDEKAEYRGIEDWNLYVEGLGLYLAAAEKESEISNQLSVIKDQLNADKQAGLNPELKKLDAALEKYWSNQANITQLISVLAEFKKPEVGSELELIWNEMEKNHEPHRRPEAADNRPPTTDIEVREISDRVERVFKSQISQQFTSHYSQFTAKKQQWMTGEITAEAFGLYLKEIAERFQIHLEISPEFLGAVHNERRLKEIEGTKLARELKHYISAVIQEGVPENQRALFARTQAKYLAERFAKLEVSREEYETIRASMGKDEWFSNPEVWVAPIAFYENAKKREEVFFENIANHGPRATNHESQTTNHSATLVVAGGFHTEGMLKRFKERGISYVLVMPKIQNMPEHSSYRAQMRGEVSWKNYFEVESGRINLYKAFVRAVRDRLLTRATGHGPRATKNKGVDRGPWNVDRSSEDIHLLKSWRDQIIRDLANQDKIEQAGRYTRFIDEILDPNHEPRSLNRQG